MLANRIRNRHRHLRKWARRIGTTAFRVYDRDIPEFPCVVDCIADQAVVWTYQRTRDEDAAADRAWIAHALAEVAAGLGIPADRIWHKRRRRQRGSQQYRPGPKRGATVAVVEGGLTFEANCSDYLDVGLFLDHRPTRALIAARAGGRRLLNCFAYTGSFSVYAIAAGAAATATLDLSNTYLDWFERNLARNDLALDGERHRRIRADALAWLAEPPRAEWDLIVCDPPTFSNSKAMGERTWDVRRDHPWLLWRLWQHLAPGGSLLFSCNARGFELAAEGLPPFAREDWTARTTDPDFERRPGHRCWWLTRPG